jgi:predicted DNA-binding transcriptional regulator AlpA
MSRILANCSKMHIWRLCNDERYRDLKFPQPIKLGSVGRHERNYWRESDIFDWIEQRARASARERTKRKELNRSAQRVESQQKQES